MEGAPSFPASFVLSRHGGQADDVAQGRVFGTGTPRWSPGPLIRRLGSTWRGSRPTWCTSPIALLLLPVQAPGRWSRPWTVLVSDVPRARQSSRVIGGPRLDSLRLPTIRRDSRRLDSSSIPGASTRNPGESWGFFFQRGSLSKVSPTLGRSTAAFKSPIPRRASSGSSACVLHRRGHRGVYGEVLDRAGDSLGCEHRTERVPTPRNHEESGLGPCTCCASALHQLHTHVRFGRISRRTVGHGRCVGERKRLDTILIHPGPDLMEGIRARGDSRPCTANRVLERGVASAKPVFFLATTAQRRPTHRTRRLEMPSKELVQMDIVYLGLAAVLFAAAFGLVALCDSLSRQKS
jgi:hypothetical protein